jgi:hypothetical protein
MVMLPPPLTPHSQGGEFKGCHHVGAKALTKTDQPLGKPRGILASFGKNITKAAQYVFMRLGSLQVAGCWPEARSQEQGARHLK